MFIDVTVVVKYGVSIKAVVEALKESLKYKVERFSGMLVDTINVNVKGVKLRYCFKLNFSLWSFEICKNR